jgi:hypothetical protein
MIGYVRQVSRPRVRDGETPFSSSIYPSVVAFILSDLQLQYLPECLFNVLR